MKKRIAVLATVAAVALLSLCVLLFQSGVASAAINEYQCDDIHNEDECNSTQGGTSVLGNQYGTPLENPLGEISVGKWLKEGFSGIGILGSFFGGEQGGFTSLDIGPFLESVTRGNWQACSNCHQSVGKPMPMHTTPKSDTDCLVCHTKHLVCAVCHDLGKGGTAITDALNKPLNGFGTGIVLPPILDQIVDAVPVIDVHKLIRHAGFIVMYAPADIGGVADIIRGLMGDDPCWACNGLISSIDDTLADKSMWKLNQLPFSSGNGQLLAGDLLSGLLGTGAAGDQYGGGGLLGGLLGGGSGSSSSSNGGLLGDLPLGLLGTN